MGTQIQIEKLVYGGDGLSRIDGEVVFTPFVLPGETVNIERSGARRHAQRATLLDITTPSPDRVPPPCPHFTQCGGCHYQHAAYPAQVLLKRDILAETLRRVGKIDFPAERIECVSGPDLGYRNRVQFHFEGGRVGFREMNSHKLAAIDQCPIASPKINEALGKLRRMVRDRRWPSFLESLEVFTDERQVQWNATAERPIAKHFFEWLAEEVPGTVGGALDYEVGEDTFTVSGASFFQVNRHLAPRLAEIALAEIAPADAAGAAAWDLYAGVGLFSLPMARRFERVTAVESGRAAAADLEKNARRARVKVKGVRQSAETFLIEANEAPDFVLADPPRTGLEKNAAARLLELAPRRISIVACDPATLARDLAVLMKGYRVDAITMVDLFPHTFHIETVARLSAL